MVQPRRPSGRTGPSVGMSRGTQQERLLRSCAWLGMEQFRPPYTGIHPDADVLRQVTLIVL
eukprot:1159543-Pelagomonas_calceolata.AAC.6